MCCVFNFRSYDDETDELIDQELRNMGLIQTTPVENSNGDVINTKDFVSNSVRTHELINDGKKRSVAT